MFCERCGRALPPNGSPCVCRQDRTAPNEKRRALASSPLLLILAVAATLHAVFVLTGAFSAEGSVFGIFSNMYYGLPTTFGTVLQFLIGALNGVMQVIPALLVLLGVWLVYRAGKETGGMKTGGLTALLTAQGFYLANDALQLIISLVLVPSALIFGTDMPMLLWLDSYKPGFKILVLLLLVVLNGLKLAFHMLAFIEVRRTTADVRQNAPIRRVPVVLLIGTLAFAAGALVQFILAIMNFSAILQTDIPRTFMLIWSYLGTFASGLVTIAVYALFAAVILRHNKM